MAGKGGFLVTITNTKKIVRTSAFRFRAHRRSARLTIRRHAYQSPPRVYVYRAAELR